MHVASKYFGEICLKAIRDFFHYVVCDREEMNRFKYKCFSVITQLSVTVALFYFT